MHKLDTKHVKKIRKIQDKSIYPIDCEIGVLNIDPVLQKELKANLLHACYYLGNAYAAEYSMRGSITCVLDAIDSVNKNLALLSEREDVHFRRFYDDLKNVKTEMLLLISELIELI